jgi:hypothetical protein
MRQRPELIVSGAWDALVREPQGTNARFSSKWQSQWGCRMLAAFSLPFQRARHFPDADCCQNLCWGFDSRFVGT